MAHCPMIHARSLTTDAISQTILHFMVSKGSSLNISLTPPKPTVLYLLAAAGLMADPASASVISFLSDKPPMTDLLLVRSLLTGEATASVPRDCRLRLGASSSSSRTSERSSGISCSTISGSLQSVVTPIDGARLSLTHCI
jgi:hypothetical protein